MIQALYSILLLAALPASVAQEGIVLNHPPDQSGGWHSDTDFVSGSSAFSLQLADDFVLDTAATIRRVAWWGDYGETSPPANETFRIRFYEGASGSALPGEILFEVTSFDTAREATGLFVSGPPGATSKYPEYLFDIALPTPVTLESNTIYWLEILQIGDPGSGFRWEWSTTDQNNFAFSFPIGAPWQLSDFGKDLAFQFSTVPEPATLTLLALGLGVSERTNRRQGRSGVCLNHKELMS